MPTITPKTGSSIAQPPTGQASARDRAIASLTGANKAPDAPVPNPTNVSPEEMGAISPSGLSTTSEATSSTSAELPKEETPAATPEEPISSQYAILARKEKAYRARELQLKQREQQLKAQEEAAKAPKAPSFDESKYVSREKLAADPFSVLAELNLSYDQLTQMAMNAPKPEEVAINNEIKALRDELRALKGEQEATKKTFEEQQTQSYQQAIKQIETDATRLVNSSPEYETIKETGSVKQVVKLIESTFSEGLGDEYPPGTILPIEEAAKMIEDELIDRILKQAQIKKIQERLKPAAQPAPTKQPDPKQPQQQTLKTLTNNVSTSRQLSARERAMLAFKGELK